MDGGGVATGTSQNTVMPLGENHMLVKSQSTYTTFEMNDPSHPYSGMNGECFGSFEIKVPSAAGGGNCVYKDDAGNMSAVRFTVTGMTAQGAITGTWAMIGGQGIFEGASGGGMFHSLTDSETGTFTNTVSGAMTMK